MSYYDDWVDPNGELKVYERHKKKCYGTHDKKKCPYCGKSKVGIEAHIMDVHPDKPWDLFGEGSEKVSSI